MAVAAVAALVLAARRPSAVTLELPGDVRAAESYLVVLMHPGGPCRRVVLEVPDLQQEAARLRGRLGSYDSTFR